MRLKQNSQIKDPIVLYRYLKSDLAQNILLSKSAGTTVKLIKMQDISSLPIIIPTIDKQLEVLENQIKIHELTDNVEKIQKNIEALENEYWSLNE